MQQLSSSISILNPISSFRSGTDAAGYIRSDVSASLKLVMKSVHGCTLFMMRQRRCAVYLQKKEVSILK